LLQEKSARCPLDLRQIREPHVNASVEQPRQEAHRARQSINLADDKRRAMQTRCGQRLLQCGAIRTLAALNLHILGNDRPIPTVEIGRHGRSLSFQAKATLGLLTRRNPVVGDEFAGVRHVPNTRNNTSNDR